MADDITLNAGVGGDTAAADDIGGIKYPRAKLSLGADGSATDALGGTGVDAAGVQRVSLATNVALPAGTNNIGGVDVLTVPADPFGANADAASATGSISAKLRFIAATGIPISSVVSTEKWSALSTETLVMPAANSLTSLANGALVISSAFDNSTNRHQRAQCYLHVRGASSFTAGTTVDVWVIESNGTTYEDGSASVTPGRPPDGFFFLRAVSTQQELYLTLDVPPALCKFLLRNSGGQAFTAVDAENTFGVRTYTLTTV